MVSKIAAPTPLKKYRVGNQMCFRTPNTDLLNQPTVQSIHMYPRVHDCPRPYSHRANVRMSSEPAPVASAVESSNDRQASADGVQPEFKLSAAPESISSISHPIIAQVRWWRVCNDASCPEERSSRRLAFGSPAALPPPVRRWLRLPSARRVHQRRSNSLGRLGAHVAAFSHLLPDDRRGRQTILVTALRLQVLHLLADPRVRVAEPLSLIHI